MEPTVPSAFHAGDRRRSATAELDALLKDLAATVQLDSPGAGAGADSASAPSLSFSGVRPWAQASELHLQNLSALTAGSKPPPLPPAAAAVGAEQLREAELSVQESREVLNRSFDRAVELQERELRGRRRDPAGRDLGSAASLEDRHPAARYLAGSRPASLPSSRAPSRRPSFAASDSALGTMTLDGDEVLRGLGNPAAAGPGSERDAARPQRARPGRRRLAGARERARSLPDDAFAAKLDRRLQERGIAVGHLDLAGAGYDWQAKKANDFAMEKVRELEVARPRSPAASLGKRGLAGRLLRGRGASYGVLQRELFRRRLYQGPGRGLRRWQQQFLGAAPGPPGPGPAALGALELDDEDENDLNAIRQRLGLDLVPLSPVAKRPARQPFEASSLHNVALRAAGTPPGSPKLSGLSQAVRGYIQRADARASAIVESTLERGAARVRQLYPAMFEDEGGADKWRAVEDVVEHGLADGAGAREWLRFRG